MADDEAAAQPPAAALPEWDEAALPELFAAAAAEDGADPDAAAAPFTDEASGLPDSVTAFLRPSEVDELGPHPLGLQERDRAPSVVCVPPLPPSLEQLQAATEAKAAAEYAARCEEHETRLDAEGIVKPDAEVDAPFLQWLAKEKGEGEGDIKALKTQVRPDDCCCCCRRC